MPKCSNWSGHIIGPSVPTIFSKASRKPARNPPPTVYRALDFLMENGLIHRIDSLNAFVGCGEIGHTDKTYFLICRDCGEAAEIHDPGLSEALATCAENADFTVERETVEIAGLCPKCRAV